jgi:hypothetical protein
VLPEGTPATTLRTPAERLAMLEKLIDDVRTGRIDPKIANAIGVLAAAALREAKEIPPPPQSKPEPFNLDRATHECARFMEVIARQVGDGAEAVSDETLALARRAAASFLAAINGEDDPRGFFKARLPSPAATCDDGGDGGSDDADLGSDFPGADDGQTTSPIAGGPATADGRPTVTATVVRPAEAAALPAAAERPPPPGSAPQPIGI